MIQKIESGVLVKIIPQKIWIEDDLLGSRHVMVQHQVEGEQPFCYCSFYYDWRYTSNSGIAAAAERLARSLGAVEPIEHKMREFPQEPRQ